MKKKNGGFRFCVFRWPPRFWSKSHCRTDFLAARGFPLEMHRAAPRGTGGSPLGGDASFVVCPLCFVVCDREGLTRIDKTRIASYRAASLYSLANSFLPEPHRCSETMHAQWRGLERAPCDAGCKNLRMEIHLLSIRCAGANASPAMRCVRRALRTMQNASVVQRVPKNAAADAAHALGWHTPDAVAATHARRRRRDPRPTPSPRSHMRPTPLPRRHT